MRVAPFVALILPSFLAACASALENPFTVFADPGQYEFLDCEQLAAQRAGRQARAQELKLLMDKAEQSTGGAFVNVVAYKSDCVAAQEDLKVIAGNRARQEVQHPGKLAQQFRHEMMGRERRTIVRVHITMKESPDSGRSRLPYRRLYGPTKLIGEVPAG